MTTPAENTVDDLNGDEGPDKQPSADEPELTELDKTLADSFPSSDPPAMP